MIGMHWVLPIPKEMTPESYDEWYLGSHTILGKNSEGMVRYAVNRVLRNQPKISTNNFYRVAQEYWETLEDMEKCWNSASGFAILGDGIFNLPPVEGGGLAITQERLLPVAKPAAYSPITRGFRGSDNGTIVKFLAFGKARAGDGKGIEEWYCSHHAHLGNDPRVREHVFGSALGRALKIGALGVLPGPGQRSFDWQLELWFDNNEDAIGFLDTSAFKTAWSELSERSVPGDLAASLVRGQELLSINTAAAHSDQ